MKRTGSIAVIVLLALALLPATAAQAAWRAESAPVPGPTVTLEYVPAPVAQSGGAPPCVAVNDSGLLDTFSHVTLNWAWPDSSGFGGNIVNPSGGFQLQVITTGLLAGESVYIPLSSQEQDSRSKTFTQAGLLALLINAVDGLVGKTIDFRLTATSHGWVSDAFTARLTFGLAGLYGDCTSPAP